MFASSCNPFKIGYLPDFPLLKTVGSAPNCFKDGKIKQTSNTIGSAPDCFKERNKNYEIDIFLKINQAAVKEITLASMGPNCPHPGQGR